MSGLEARLGTRLGEFSLDVELSAPSTGTTALFGPSGAGKTTLLRCVAGLAHARPGRIFVDGSCWQDDDRGLFLEPHRRAVGFVFQDSRLFEHMSVRRNLEYGRKRTAADRGRVDFDEVIEWLGVGPLLSRSPASLSGGERQRVAIARALVTSPRLLLLDEPLASLDEASRREILPYLERLHERLSIPVLYVSHSLRDVVRLADHMVWLDGGRVRAAGPLAGVLTRLDLAREHDDEALALIETVVSSHDDEYHLTELAGPCGTLRVRRIERAPGQPVRVRVLARDVSLSLDEETRSSILNVFRVEVAGIAETEPGQMLVRLVCGDGDAPQVLLARITRKSCDRLELQPGTPVYARVKSVSLAD